MLLTEAKAAEAADAAAAQTYARTLLLYMVNAIINFGHVNCKAKKS